MQSSGGVKGFLKQPVGQALLIAIATLTVVGTFLYVSLLLAIPDFLLFGLAIPIWVGLKRPRYLAIAGLITLLAAAPITTALLTQELLVPIGVASSGTSLPEGNGGAVLQNATVSPFVAQAGTNFTWTVDVFPQYLPPGNSTPLWMNLYVSSCPGATGNSSPYCSSGYPLWIVNYTFSKGDHNVTPVTYHLTISSNNIWSWQMGLVTNNTTNGRLWYTWLNGDPTYNSLEGPITGNYGTTYLAVVGEVYLETFLYLGAVYYAALLIYVWLKARERRKQDDAQRLKEMSGGGPSAPAAGGPPGSAPSGPPGKTGAAAAPGTLETACPNCNAVVYQNETTCWKCGASLAPSSGSGTPLPSGKSP